MKRVDGRKRPWYRAIPAAVPALLSAAVIVLLAVKAPALLFAAVPVLLLAALAVHFLHRSDPADAAACTPSGPHITGRTQVSAHRSGGGIMPEETLMAFRYCAENPDFRVDGFEFDLHITKDDVLVLLHDGDLDRTSDSARVFGAAHVRPEEKTYAELRTLNMGAGFTAPDGSRPYAGLSGDAVPDDLRILSLDAVLDYLQGAGDFSYIVEIKNGGALGCRAADLLYRSVSERGLLDRVVYGSFHGEVSRHVDRTHPDLVRGGYPAEVAKLYLASLLGLKGYRPPCRTFQLPFNDLRECYGVNLGTSRLINYAHARGVALQYWTVNDEADMEYLISMGADCIMSDYPDRLYAVQQRLRGG